MSEALDPFAAYAVARGVRDRPMKVKIAKSDADAPMKPTAMEEQQREKAVLLGQFKRHKRKEHEGMLSGAHGKAYAELVAITKKLPDSAKALVEYLRKPWVEKLDRTERHICLSLISARIILEREKQGLSPMDDPLPGAPLNLFLICKAQLKVT